MTRYDDVTLRAIGNPLYRWQRDKQFDTEHAAQVLGIPVERYEQIIHLTPMADDEVAVVAEKTGISQDDLTQWTAHLRQHAIGRALREQRRRP